MTAGEPVQEREKAATPARKEVIRLFLVPFLILFGLGMLGVPKWMLLILLVGFFIYVNMRLRNMKIDF